MNVKRVLIATTCTLALGSNWTLAQDDVEGENDDLEVTIAVMPQDAELPDVVTTEISLPTDEDGNFVASDEGVENSADGLAIANDARADGRAFGEAAAAAAEANREELGRASIPNLVDLIPGQAADPADVPDLPDVPATPPRP